MFVEMGIDRIHHGFWRYQDPGHRLYQPNSPYESAIREYYRYVDREIGVLLDHLDSDTALMVVSDHGAKRMEGAICVNEWLIKQGYLHLREAVEKPTALKGEMIDWGKTKVWGEGGYYSRIFLNVEGREPHGTIPQEDYDAFRDRLRDELASLGDEDGRSIGTRVFKPQEIYRSVRNIPPDLIVYFGDLNWRGAGTVGNGRIHIYENDTGPDDANHAEDGIFILKTDPKRYSETGVKPGQTVDDLSLYDVAPTILDHFGISTPPDMVGRSILSARAEEVPAGSEPQGAGKSRDYSEEEEEIIRKRLEDLGYL
jgi:predicted AlkP superfamily phosphohydrolase/phosphomutase